MLIDSTTGDLEVIVRKCKGGDTRAWCQLVDRLEPLVWSTIRRTGLPKEDSEDVFQSVFLTLHRNLDRLESAVALPKWIATTAAREAIRHRTRQVRVSSMTVSDEGLDEVLAAEDRAVDQLVEEVETSRMIQEAVRLLPGQCRDILVALYSSDEKSYKEITDQLGIAIGSIGPKRARCLEKLRQILSEKGFFADVSTTTEVAS